MRDIQRVAILGAGAIGSYFASSFFDTPGFSSVLIAKGKRLERLQSNGLVINGIAYQIPVTDPEKSESPVDLIIVALKHHHLEQALQGLGKMVNDSTVFLSFMNGLESEEMIGSLYGMDKVLYGISVGIDAVRQGNQISYTKPGKHFFGEARNEAPSQRVLQVQKAFERAGIAYEVPMDMLRMMWWKFMVNVGMNQASAVMRAPYGIFQKNPNAQALMEALMREVIALAKVLEVNLKHDDIEDWYAFLKTLSPQGKTSMLQDIEAGRQTEVEIFGGKVVELGQAHGVPTPINQTVLQIMRVLTQSPVE